MIVTTGEEESVPPKANAIARSPLLDIMPPSSRYIEALAGTYDHLVIVLLSHEQRKALWIFDSHIVLLLLAIESDFNC